MIACDDRRDNRYFLLQVKLIRTIRHYHFNAARVVALLACLAAASVWAEDRNIYLIASEPYDNSSYGFPTLLYRVEGRRLVKVRTITTHKQNTRFVDVYPARGVALVGSDRTIDRGSLLLDVIDMSSVSTQKSYDIDICDACTYISSHMQDRHDAQAYFFIGYNEGHIYKGVDLRTGRMLKGFDWLDEANAYRTGTGSSFVDGLRSFSRVMHGSEVVIYGGESLRHYELGWRLPEGFGWELGSTITAVLVNNDDIRVISVYRHSEWNGELRGLGLHVFDKAAAEWSKLDVHSGAGSFRAFGHWLVREEIQSYKPGALDLKRLEWQCFPPFLSAAVNLSMVRGIAPSGRLFFYNALTNASVEHDTGEPNSEVLYVDEYDVAWFRVGDELRRAPIEDGMLGPTEILVKAPELWPVHWLFFGKD